MVGDLVLNERVHFVKVDVTVWFSIVANSNIFIDTKASTYTL